MMLKTQPRSGKGTIKILIVDDHPVVREGLSARLEKQADLEVCGQTGDFNEALQMSVSAAPDIAIIDLSLKTGHGLELIKRIKARNPSVRILVWSMYPDSLYAERALHAGAMGYVNKENATDQIIEAIRRLQEGKIFLSEPMAQRLLSQAAADSAQISPLENLSDRELETFELLGQGMDTVQIADKMCLSPKTVETYRARIKDKLHLRKSTELMQRAVQWVMENK
jgi:DNA-binding NarL/FixJ family response regulator